ncbi:MAG: hypothetical protein GX682_02440 [Clostridiaceae bacterium]|nr:hypothetical protein [Clostridiaceae bacterium]
MASETSNKKEETRGRENTFLIIAVVAPIAIAILIGGGPAIWKGITQIFKVIIPNFWVIVAYIYIALVGFLIGRRSKK